MTFDPSPLAAGQRRRAGGRPGGGAAAGRVPDPRGGVGASGPGPGTRPPAPEAAPWVEPSGGAGQGRSR